MTIVIIIKNCFHILQIFEQHKIILECILFDCKSQATGTYRLFFVSTGLNSFAEKRNIWGADRLFLSVNNPAYAFLEGLYEGGGPQDKEQVASVSYNVRKQ